MSAAIAALPSKPSNRFVNNNDGTITDNTTGLMWSQHTLCEEEVNHATAARICADLHLADHNDWRLPTIAELFTLVDHSHYNPAIDADAFPDTKSDWYWTSTITAWSSVYAWFVNFSYGDAYYSHRGDDYAFVRAVRSLPAGQ